MNPRPPAVAAASAALATGQPVLLLDDVNPPHRTELVFAAEHARPDLVAFVVRHSSGFLTVALTGADADRLGLPPMWPWSPPREQPAFTITADAAEGITTGISASDRATTVRILGSATATADLLRRPGHVVPLRTALGTPGVPEAALDLLRLAGAHPAAAMATLVDHRGELTSPATTGEFANDHGLAVVPLSAVAAHQAERTRDVPVPEPVPATAGRQRDQPQPHRGVRPHQALRSGGH